MKADLYQAHEVVQTATRFAHRHISPLVMDVDHADPCFPEEVFTRGIQAGFDRFILPETAGGNGFGPVDLCVLVKALAESCAGHAMVFGVHAAVLKILFDTATPTSERLVEEIPLSGRPLAVTIPEPISGNDFEMAVTVTRGNTLHSFDAGLLAVNASSSGWFLLFAKTADGTPLALLSAAKAESLVPGDPEPTLGIRAMPICELKIVEHSVEDTHVIAEGSDALLLYRSLLSKLSMVVAAASCGVMTSAVKTALKYASERYQGGKMIIDHSHVRNILGRMRADATTCWGAVTSLAAQDFNHGVALGTKVPVTESAVRVCTDAVQVLGGYGYMRDYGLEKAMRDAAVLSLLPVSNARAELVITAVEKEKVA